MPLLVLLTAPAPFWVAALDELCSDEVAGLEAGSVEAAEAAPMRALRGRTLEAEGFEPEADGDEANTPEADACGSGVSAAVNLPECLGDSLSRLIGEGSLEVNSPPGSSSDIGSGSRSPTARSKPLPFEALDAAEEEEEFGLGVEGEASEDLESVCDWPGRGKVIPTTRLAVRFCSRSDRYNKKSE